VSNTPIAAIATAPGRGAVGIVRVSGMGIAPIVESLCGRALSPREATYLPFQDADGNAIDSGLALFFPAPHSYTGEDVLELQAHGGAVVMQLLLARCLEAGKDLGIRIARAGEFTERAFLNDKLDLAQAEAVADLIDASTEAAARSASRSLSGEFSQTIHVLRDALIHLRMLVEATLDFPEEDIDFLQQADARGQLQKLQTQLAAVMQRTTQGALLREGIKLVIAGQPNAGKSSLLNALAGAELAIVTPIAGTTRDVVQQTIQIEGVPVHVLDTAGLRDSTAEQVDEVEKIGIARAWQHIESADVILFLHDLTKQGDAAHAKRDGALQARLPASGTVIDVWNKADLKQLGTDPNCLTLSAKTGAGLAELRAAILKTVGWQATTDGLFIARQRHVHALQGVGEHLELAREHLESKAPALEVIAEELRLALNDLSSITGEFTPDDLLGEIFSKFCIGK
jgi:tRNA modification GTPase